MKHNLSDLFNAEIGDVLTLTDATSKTEIYAEAVANGKWVSLGHNPVHCTWVVNVLNPDDLTNSIITDHIVMSNYHGILDDGRMTLKIPGHINHKSLKSRCYITCKGHVITFFEDYLVITEKVSTVNTQIIMDNFNTGDIKTIHKSQCKNVRSTITALYKIASDNNITISIRTNRNAIIITHRGMVDPLVPQESFTSKLEKWLTKLPYDLTVEIPVEFTRLKSTAYINTVINKSKFTCKTRNGGITKLSAALKKRAGTIELIVNEKVIKVINKPSLTNITKNDRKLINLALAPYKKRYEDVR